MPNYIRRKYRMRKYARAHGIDIPRGFRPATFGFGTPAKMLLRSIKAHAKMRADAVWTQAVQDLLFPPAFGKAVVRIARAEVGVREFPPNSNDGVRIRLYQDVTRMFRQPWCASFVCWVLRQAARLSGKPEPKFAPLAAYVPSWTAMINRGERGWREVAFTSARAGDVVTLWNSGHIEIVRRRAGDYLLCVGGNTSPVGQNANGGMVALTKRHRSEVTAIGRPA